MVIKGVTIEQRVSVPKNSFFNKKPATFTSTQTASNTNNTGLNALRFLGHNNYLSFVGNSQAKTERYQPGIYPKYKLKINAGKTIPQETAVDLKAQASRAITGQPVWKKPVINPNIWMVTAETSTFMKTGGLGDVAVDLPEAFNNEYNKGKNTPKMTIVQPLYESGELVKLEKTGDKTYQYTSKPMGGTIGLEDTGEKVEVAVGKNKTTTVSVLKGVLNGTEYRFLRNEDYFGKLPNDGKKVSPYVKNDSGVGESERFAFFSKAVANYIKDLKEKGSTEAPDVIDANDWHAGPLAAQFKYLMPAKAANGEMSKELAQDLKDLPIVYTLHNLEYQGWDYPNTSKILNLLYEDYANSIFKNSYAPKMNDTPRSVIVRDTYNAAMHGLSLANTVVAVSPHYSEEIASHKFYGYDFVDLLSERSKHHNLTGIVNGIGQAGIVPDGGLAKKVQTKFPEFKLYNKSLKPAEVKTVRAQNKKTFIELIQKGIIEERLGLKDVSNNKLKSVDISKIDNTPLLTVVSRLEGQKGVDMMADSIKHVLTKNPVPGKELPVVVILGTGNQAKLLNKLKEDLPEKLANRVVFYNAFSVDLMHMIQTAGDMFLMPSKFEPCGLGQLQAMAKGNVPVATATGGLSDTIIAGKTGFIANNYHPDNIKASTADYNKTLARAVKVFHNNREAFDQIAYNALQADFSWKNSGSLEKYLKLFQTGNTKGIARSSSNVA